MASCGLCDIGRIARIARSGMDFDPTALTATQLKAARQLVGWSAEALAARAGVGIATVRRAELSREFINRIKPETVCKVVRTLQRAGVILFARDTFGGPGVRLSR
jgi:transcriptional regulator with XRE-family HTH domain